MNDPVTERLVRVGSETRGHVLVQEMREATPSQARQLAAEWFNICDALEPWVEELREQLERVHQAGLWVTDGTDPKLELPVVVYRAAWEGDQSRALSWTTKLEKAEWFARYLTGPRAWWLGIKREEEGPFIYQGLCTEAYGFLDNRDEAEVIAKTVLDIEPIKQLVTVKEGAVT